MQNKYISNASIILENIKLNESKENVEKKKTSNPKSNTKESPNDFVDLLNKNKKKSKKMAHFKENVNNYLLGSALNTVFDMVLEGTTADSSDYSIGHNILKRYVEETGYNNIKNRFYKQNLTLSEIARYTDQAVEEVMREEVANTKDNNNPDDTCFSMDKDVADKFTMKIKKLIPDSTVKIIQNRVGDSIQNFINQSIDKQEKIRDIYMRANSKITSLTPEEKSAGYDEDYTAFAKRDVNKVYNQDSSVLEAMYRIMAENIYKDKALNEEFSDGNGNMDVHRLINDCSIIYSVLEMMNTMEMVDVDSDYIHSVLEDLKAY